MSAHHVNDGLTRRGSVGRNGTGRLPEVCNGVDPRGCDLGRRMTGIGAIEPFTPD